MWFDFRHYEEEKRKTKHKKKEKEKWNIERKNEEQRTPHNWAYVFSTSSNPNSLQTIMEYS